MSGIIAQNILDNSGLIKAPAGGGSWNFIKKLTASSSSTLSFVDGTDDVDLSYKEILFTLHNMHSSTYAQMRFQVDVNGSTSYNTTVTSTAFRAANREDGTDEHLEYVAGDDQAQGTSFHNLGTESAWSPQDDMSTSGYVRFYDLSNTTYVKHFVAKGMAFDLSPWYRCLYFAGYFNTTTAIDKVQFKFSAGNMDTGQICCYGLST